MSDYTGQSQNPGRDPLAQHLVDVAWVHVGAVADPGDNPGAVLAQVDEATKGAVAAVLRALADAAGQWSQGRLDALAFEVDQV